MPGLQDTSELRVPLREVPVPWAEVNRVPDKFLSASGSTDEAQTFRANIALQLIGKDRRALFVVIWQRGDLQISLVTEARSRQEDYGLQAGFQEVFDWLPELGAKSWKVLGQYAQAQVALAKPVSDSAPMKAVLALCELAAGSQSPVLLTGPTGAGKTHLARYIHAKSARGVEERAFKELNCGAIPDGLAESELFGHEKGAYAGAHEAKDGMLKAADGGTIFLDEIDKFARWPVLLRAVEDSSFRRVGSVRNLPVDVRLIAASASTDIPLEMYYRLGAFVIEVPPLRDHKEDIASLAASLIATICGNEAAGRATPKLSPRALSTLRSHDYPGNVRELRNVLTRAVHRMWADASAFEIEPRHIDFLTGRRGATAGTFESVDRAVTKYRGAGRSADRLGAAVNELLPYLAALDEDVLRQDLPGHKEAQKRVLVATAFAAVLQSSAATPIAWPASRLGGEGFELGALKAAARHAGQAVRGEARRPATLLIEDAVEGLHKLGHMQGLQEQLAEGQTSWRSLLAAAQWAQDDPIHGHLATVLAGADADLPTICAAVEGILVELLRYEGFMS